MHKQHLQLLGEVTQLRRDAADAANNNRCTASQCAVAPPRRRTANSASAADPASIAQEDDFFLCSGCHKKRHMACAGYPASARAEPVVLCPNCLGQVGCEPKDMVTALAHADMLRV